jgi:hypothetical protein
MKGAAAMDIEASHDLEHDPLHHPWMNEHPKEARWPLIVSFLIAFPVIVVFALALSRETKTGNALGVLSAYLMFTGLIVGCLATLAIIVRAYRNRILKKESQKQSSIDGQHLDQWFDPRTPFGKKQEIPPREFSVGPGLGLHQRYHCPVPKPKRRI